MKNNISKIFLFLLVLSVLTGCTNINKKPTVSVNSFEDCSNQGGVIMESYPRQCAFESQIYTEELTAIEDATTGGPIGEEVVDSGLVDNGTHTCSDQEKLNEACTREYMPVCGNDGITYGNGCSACAAQVDPWTNGECIKQAHTCTPEEKLAEICTMEYAPVCGNDGVTYSNGCSACSTKEVKSWFQGECNLS